MLLAFLIAIPLAGLQHPVAGVENYALTPLPSRTQESDAPGVILQLNVDGASTGLPYDFTWRVWDPAGNERTFDRSTVPTQSSFVLSVNFPSDFGGNAHINYVGVYDVNVTQTLPSPVPSVATGRFEARLTDAAAYQRTNLVSIRARGYQGGDNVTVDVRLGGSPAQGYPKFVLADNNGNVAHSWLPLPSTPVGNYTITLTGLNTPPKSPPDTHTFTVYPTNVTISQILMPVSSLQKTETAEFAFSANYLNGASVQSGSAVVRVAEPDQTSHLVTANWNSSFFVAKYRVLLNSQNGIWVATIDPARFDDGFGNGGPLTSPVKGFVVNRASLMISAIVPNGTRTVGDIILVSASITSPDGSSFSQGNVTAQFILSGRPVGNLVALAYDQSRALWVGSYVVRENDESGAWIVQVSASDSYGNGGLGSTSLLVSVPAQNPITSGWFLSLVAALAGGILLSFFFFKKKMILRRQIHVDLRAVGREVDRVKSQDFFKKVQEQLNRKKEGPEKESDG